MKKYLSIKTISPVLCLLIFLFSGIFDVKGQNYHIINHEDKYFLKEFLEQENPYLQSLEKFPFLQITPLTHCLDSYTGCIIESDSLYNQLMEHCPMAYPAPDFSKQILLVTFYGGDCYLRIQHRLYFDEDELTLHVVGFNIWGGCRAAGWETCLIQIDKLEKNSTVEFYEVLIDSMEEYENVFGQSD